MVSPHLHAKCVIIQSRVVLSRLFQATLWNIFIRSLHSSRWLRKSATHLDNPHFVQTSAVDRTFILQSRKSFRICRVFIPKREFVIVFNRLRTDSARSVFELIREVQPSEDLLKYGLILNQTQFLTFPHFPYTARSRKISSLPSINQSITDT